MTIIIHFHLSHYRDFKAYYTDHVCRHLCSEFPNLVCHERFVAWQDIDDWVYGIKSHFVINNRGELLACQPTPDNMDDRAPVPPLAQRLFGKLFADKDYISQALLNCSLRPLAFNSLPA